MKKKPHILFDRMTKLWRCANGKYVGWGLTPIESYLNWRYSWTISD